MKDVIKAHGVKDFPSAVLLPADGGDPIPYDKGKFSFHKFNGWLSKHALDKPVKGKKKKPVVEEATEPPKEPQKEEL